MFVDLHHCLQRHLDRLSPPRALKREVGRENVLGATRALVDERRARRGRQRAYRLLARAGGTDGCEHERQQDNSDGDDIGEDAASNIRRSGGEVAFIKADVSNVCNDSLERTIV